MFTLNYSTYIIKYMLFSSVFMYANKNEFFIMFHFSKLSHSVFPFSVGASDLFIAYSIFLTCPA